VLRSISSSVHADANTPVGPQEPRRSLVPGTAALPRISGGSAPTLPFSRPAQRLLVFRPARSPSRPTATLYTGGSDGFVSSTTAPIATGWSD